jgi:secreted trypsin-like serine protease
MWPLLFWTLAQAAPVETGGVQWITGGQPVEDGAWPSAASVRADGWARCSGVLVAPTLVLTAGHCDSDELDAVFLGGSDLWDMENGELISIVQRTRYPDHWRTFDVSLLTLETPAATTPSPIVRDCALGDLLDGAPVEIVGFGTTDRWGTQSSHVLVSAKTTITDADCSQGDVGCHEDVQPGGELIAGGDGVDTCEGDSGGPLYLWTATGEPVLAGVTSRGVSPADPPCGNGGIYTRLDAIADWIEAESGQELTGPDCDLPRLTANPTSPSPSPWTQDSAVDTGDFTEEPRPAACACSSGQNRVGAWWLGGLWLLRRRQRQSRS